MPKRVPQKQIPKPAPNKVVSMYTDRRYRDMFILRCISDHGYRIAKNQADLIKLVVQMGTVLKMTPDEVKNVLKTPVNKLLNLK